MTDKRPELEFSPKPPEHGLVEVFTGEGRGKTSAAMGIALRATGQKLRVYIIFFMKGDYPYGERLALARLPNVAFSSFGQEYFVNPKKITPEEVEKARKGLQKAAEVINSGQYDVVILDEINVAVSYKLLVVEDVLQLIKNKPRNVELILTGRNADPKLIEAADLVTEMVKIKHPYDRGITARPGIDY